MGLAAEQRTCARDTCPERLVWPTFVASRGSIRGILRPMKQDEITEAMERLNAPERARREAVEDLIWLGVADLGEEIASRFYN
jgi:hypothetical protein